MSVYIRDIAPLASGIQIALHPSLGAHPLLEPARVPRSTLDLSPNPATNLHHLSLSLFSSAPSPGYYYMAYYLIGLHESTILSPTFPPYPYLALCPRKSGRVIEAQAPMPSPPLPSPPPALSHLTVAVECGVGLRCCTASH